jgi:predicted MFS family arabinose efflux permease
MEHFVRQRRRCRNGVRGRILGTGRLLILMLAAGTFAVGVDAVIISGLLPGISSSLDVSSGAAGQLVTVFALGYAILAPV